jgi:hypothetical protein
MLQQNLSCVKFKKIDPIIVAKTWIESFTYSIAVASIGKLMIKTISMS